MYTVMRRHAHPEAAQKSRQLSLALRDVSDRRADSTGLTKAIHAIRDDMVQPYTFCGVRFFGRVNICISQFLKVSALLAWCWICWQQVALAMPCMVSQITTMCQGAFTAILLQRPFGRLQSSFRSTQLCRACGLHSLLPVNPFAVMQTRTAALGPCNCGQPLVAT